MEKPEVAKVTLVDLLVHTDPEIRRLAQEILDRLIEDYLDERTRHE